MNANIAGTDETLVSRFWQHVAQMPDAPAQYKKPTTEAEKVQLTYQNTLPKTNLPRPNSKYLMISWAQLGKQVRTYMQYLASKGVVAGDRVAIYAWNSPDWTCADLAIQSLGAATVTVYPNNSAEQVDFILRDSGSKVAFVGADKFEDVKTLTGTTFIGLTAPIDQPLTAPAQAITPVVDPNALATLIYTSGTTGTPKGVKLTQRNVAAAISGILSTDLKFTKEDLYLSYLPLAHVYEKVDGQAICIWSGTPSAFCTVPGLPDAIHEVRPTVLAGVPAVWRKIRDQVYAKVAKSGFLKKTIFNTAIKFGNNQLLRPLFDKLVFKAVRDGLGGRLRMMVSGSAPIPPEVLAFYNIVGLNMLEGYGLTETAGGIAVNSKPMQKLGSVGQMIPGVEIKIVPEPDATDKTVGDIFLKGDCIFSGYWNRPDEDAKSFKDGWFDTGDVGVLDADGYLTLKDRKKLLLKTDGGKYVAPAKVAAAFDGNELVQHVVAVGDGKPFIGALIFVNLLPAAAIANLDVSKGDHDGLMAKLAANPAVIAAVKQAVDQANKKLEHWETVKQFEIVPVEPTVANNLLTPTLKIKNVQVIRQYKPLVDLIYSRKK